MALTSYSTLKTSIANWLNRTDLTDEIADDFIKLAEAYGAIGLRATKPEEVEPVLRKGLSSKKTVIMDFVVAKEECVYPMVPAGAPITEMLLV